MIAPLRFDPKVLRHVAGNRVHDRGAAYVEAGRVTLISVDPARVRARVSGTEEYRVELGPGPAAEGHCSCPAFADAGFCKHMVAVALAANAAPEGAGALDDQVRAHLAALPTERLVSMILACAAQDDALRRRLEHAAASTAGDIDRAEAVLHRALDAQTRDLPDYRGVATWAREIRDLLDEVATLAEEPGAERRGAAAALRLAERALSQVEEALNQIDDSNGEGSMVLEHAAEIHRMACTLLCPDPVALARDLYARELADDHDLFRGAAIRYAEALGEAGRAEYRRLAQADWDRLSPLSPRDRQGAYRSDHWRLQAILDGFAAEEGDLATRIALRKKDLSSPYAYLELAQFCRDQGRPDAALAHAEEGLWVFEDERPDARLLRLATDLLIAAGRPAEAETHLWRAFAANPDAETYSRLSALGGEAARDRALAALETRLAGAAQDRWSEPADLLVRLLIREQLFARAWAVAGSHRLGAGLAEVLARASEASHPREALAVHAARVHALADQGGNRAYAEAAELVTRMAALQAPEAQVAFLAALRLRYARRRNLLALLPDPQPAPARADARSP